MWVKNVGRVATGSQFRAAIAAHWPEARYLGANIRPVRGDYVPGYGVLPLRSRSGAFIVVATDGAAPGDVDYYGI